MVGISSASRTEVVAQDIVEVFTRLCLVTPRGQRRPDDLKEGEFLTLALLRARGTLVVGTIQRLLGVLPAQMSRTIRSLEDRPEPFISCRINAQDKRKIDVDLTSAGARALQEHQAARVRRLGETLQALSDEEREEIVQLVAKVRAALDQVNT